MFQQELAEVQDGWSLVELHTLLGVVLLTAVLDRRVIYISKHQAAPQLAAAQTVSCCASRHGTTEAKFLYQQMGVSVFDWDLCVFKQVVCAKRTSQSADAEDILSRIYVQ